MVDMREFIQFSTLLNLSIRDVEFNDQDTKRICEINQEIGQSRMMELACKVKMLPFVAKTMTEMQIDTNTWQPILLRYRERNRAVIEELARVYEQFASEGVQKVFVSENFGAMLAAGGDIGLFASGDADNYADIEEREKLCATFESRGYKHKDRYVGNLLISTEFTHERRLPKGFSLGIDYYPLSRLTLPCFIDADQFVDWSNVRRYEATTIQLPPADALMYICLLHISLHSFCRAPAIRLYRDIVNASCVITGRDWENIAAWAKRDKTCRRIATAGRISHEIAGTDIPQIITELAGESNKHLFSIAFDKQNCVLRPEPSRLEVLRIETSCSDQGLVHGVGGILFPDKQWMRTVYGSCGVSAHLKQLRKVL